MSSVNTKIIRSHRRTVAVHVLPTGEVVVKAPVRVSMGFINQFIDKHKEWIEKRLEQVQKQRVRGKIYKNGEKFLYLGKEYSLEIGDYKTIEAKNEKLLFSQVLEFRIQKELTAWYIRQGRKIITEQVEYYTKQMGVQYIGLTFSDTKSQWGRCTHDNRLQFSWRLVMAPLLTINYVVVHELEHTKEKNHSRAFWSKVRLFNPSYRQQIKWLKENGKSLIV